MAVKYRSDYNVDGTVIGQDASELIGFYGATPVVRASGASQAAITTLTGSKTTTNVAAKLNLLIKFSMKVRTDLVAYGLIKGAS